MTKLSESEWKILSALWEIEPQTIMQLTDTLRDSTGWSKNTVITLLKRMEDKQAVEYVQSGNAKNYYSVVKRKDVALEETQGFLKRIYNGSIGMMVNSLIKEKALTKEEISELYDILKSAEGDGNSDA